MDRFVVHPCKPSNKQSLRSFLRKASSSFYSGFLRLIMEENKSPPLESELAAAMAEFDMEEDSKHEPFVKRFDTPDEIVQYWEHQLEKVREWTY